jgi:hypothetical protein
LQICISNNISNPTAPGKTSYWTMTSPILSLSGTTNPTTNTTRYRAELTSILTILYIIYRTEQEHPPSNPFTVAIQCSNQKALKEALCESPLGVTTANQPNHDLIMDIRFLRNSIRTHFKPFLGENHVNKSPPSPIESDYSAFQDFLINPNPKHKAAAKDQTPLSHVITILLQGQPIQQDLRSTLHTLEYAEPLQRQIMKDNNWTEEQFHSVSWSAYHQAIRRIPRSHRILISKLSHQLWNTNCQNSKFYGESDLCPICNTTPETIPHLYQCCHPSAVANFHEGLTSLARGLQTTTPNEIEEHIITGLTQWRSGARTQSPTQGSRLPALTTLNHAFEEQSELGWDAFLRGHLSSRWIAAYRETYRPKKPLTQTQLTIATDQWASNLIRLLWIFSEKIWQLRNNVVHGKLEEFRQNKAVKKLKEDVIDLYEQFHTDPYMMPNTRNYLFNKPLATTLAMDKDSIACWIKSVKEGIYTREHRKRLAQERLKRTIHNFFQRKALRGKLGTNSLSLWKAPFSTSYYSKHFTTARRSSSNSSNKKFRNKGRCKTTKKRKGRLCTVCPMRSLDKYGFTKNSRNTKPQAKLGVASKLDFSGTLVSTAP